MNGGGCGWVSWTLDVVFPSLRQRLRGCTCLRYNAYFTTNLAIVDSGVADKTSDGLAYKRPSEVHGTRSISLQDTMSATLSCDGVSKVRC